ncbi:hypothetical protein [Streptomyces sp. NPDC096153]|uniref:hypothetical protein n=1 Tax=Streptomyces sp. NPDC096153 TaxID=3155548 RepID=UPI00331D83C6
MSTPDRIRAERDCLALAVAFALQWKEHAPKGLREGIEEILATMPAAEGESTPEFFQPGRTYVRFVGDRELYFRVTSVSTDNPNSPDSLNGGGPVAFGWSRTDRSSTVWGPTGQSHFAGWHDVTEGGETA